MTPSKSSYVFFLLVTFSWQLLAEPSNALPKKLSLATTNWCPYTCFDNNPEFGIIGIYLKKILSAHDVELTVTSYPWSRAIRLVNEASTDGLLTAIPSEAPHLLFSKSPIGSYQMCFYTLKRNAWALSAPLNFEDNLLAIVQDYGYGEPLDSYLNNHDGMTAISGGDVTKRLITLLFKQRVDIIVADKLVVEYKTANDSNIDANLMRVAGCLPKNHFYLALSPSQTNQRLLQRLENDIQQPGNKLFLQGLKMNISHNKEYR